MSLWGKDQIPRKLGVSKECPDTLNDVAIMELEVFTSNREVLGLERWSTGQLLVDDLVKLFACVIRQSELFDKLPTCLVMQQNP